MRLIRIHSLVLRLMGDWNGVWSILEEGRKCVDIRWNIILWFEQKRKLVLFNIVRCGSHLKMKVHRVGSDMHRVLETPAMSSVM